MKSRLHFLHFVFFIFLVHFQSGNAQSQTYHHFLIEDGLPGSNLYRINQDAKGFIWICTDMGLVRYNGYEFETFTVKDGLPHNDIWSLFEDSQGRIWLETFGTHICYMQEGEVHCFENDTETAGAQILKFYEGQSGQIWVVISGDLFKIKDEKLVKFGGDENSIFGSLNTFFARDIITRAGKLNKDKTFFLLDDTLTPLPELPTISKNEVIHFPRLEGDTLIYFNGKRIKKWKGNQPIAFDQPTQATSFSVLINSLEPKKINFIKAFRDTLFCATANDYLKIDITYLVDNFNETSSIFKDIEQNLWLTTRQGDLFILPKKAQNTYSFTKEHELLKEQNIIAVTKDLHGTIYFGTERGLIYKLKDNRISHINIAFYDEKNQLVAPRTELKDLCSTGDYLWAINNQITTIIYLPNISQGINQVPLIKKTSVLHPDYLLKNTSYFKKTNGFFELGGKSSFAEGSQLSVAHTSYFIHYEMGVDSISFFARKKTSELYGVATDKNGRCYLGGPKGLLLYQDDSLFQLTSQKEQHTILSRSIKWLTIDKEKTLWAATDGYGVYAKKGSAIFTIPEIKNEIVKNIYVDDNNHVWAATNKGAFWIKDIQFEPFQYKIQKITTAYGLASNEVNDVIVSKNKAYIATGKGLSILNLSTIEQDTLAAPLYISNISINGKTQPIQSEFDLAYFENSLAIEFIALSYKSAGNITYEYKMEGIDSLWKTTNSRNMIYPKLTPGNNYTFHLRAKDINDVYARPLRQIQFNIKSPWWATLWFKVSSITALMLITLAIFYWRVRYIKQRETEKTRINKKMAELELQALQAQMNPHFIFNSLQAIQSFIANKDERATNKYMSNFAKLMRLFLESSKEKFISLDSEIELLSLYLSLEQIRFEPPFEYSIDVPSDMPIGSIEIPSVLLQPFLENAVNHGLRYKKEKGFINVQFREKDGYLKITIEDNGVGRKKAEEIKKQATKSHQSRGMQIIQERIETLKFVENYQIKIDIQDIVKEGKVAGTIVTIDVLIEE